MTEEASKTASRRERGVAQGMKVDLSPSRLAGNLVIADYARGEVQTFFDEIKNDTRNYRTIAGLGEQIAQEYRGRCVLELLQNAHDALSQAETNDPRRISFVLNTRPEPVLLIGNTGRPFHDEDFKGLCRLAQSPKDPNQSVGNKGLGFRSVLAVSKAPEIWSTTPIGSDQCFAFRFDPAVIDCVASAAQDLERGVEVRSPFHPNKPLVDWSHEQLDQFRRSVVDRKIDVAVEAKFLSPYQLPLQVEATPADVRRLLDMGHVTVVRLPLDASADAVQSVKEQLDDLREARSVVFLDHVADLVMEVEGDRHSLMRTVDRPQARPHGHKRISQRRLHVQSAGTSPDEGVSHRFRVWTRVLSGDDDPGGTERIRSAVALLPNRWPEVRQATVGIAVEETPDVVEGAFVIFLPTDKATGTGAYVNAPFYGSLDRRDIDFNETYNELVLEGILDLCLDTVRELAGGPPDPWCGRAVLDIVASTALVAGEQWDLLSKLRGRAEEGGDPLDDQAIILCEDGWGNPREARLMPDFSEVDPIGSARWREHAAFRIVSRELDGRKNALVNLLDESCPTHREWVKTIERIAQEVCKWKPNVTWDDFLRSLLEVLPQDCTKPGPYGQDPLAEARFLPTADGRLIAKSDATTLFFRPVQGFDDVAEPVQNVPKALKQRLAFLHPGVRTHEGQAHSNTEVQKFLDGRFVKTYRSEDLLREVVVPALPRLPARHESAEATRCAEILQWAHGLFGDEPPHTLLPYLRRLPVCCHDGWRPLTDAIFGPGWPDRRGDDVATLADELADKTTLRSLLLLPPADGRWLIGVENWANFLTRIGVVDGLRLRAVEVAFSMAKSYHSDLPKKPPSGTPREAWGDWCNAVRSDIDPHFAMIHEYALPEVKLLSEIHHVAELTPSARRALSDLLLCSIGRWDVGWESVVVKKASGQAWQKDVTSPLKHWLRTIAWLHDGDDVARPLSRRWLVPESLFRGQAERYNHLDPLPLDLVRKVGIDQELQDRLVMLGLNVYPTEATQTGPELLEALAQAWTDGRVSPGRFDVFLGQVRDAWRHLDLAGGFPSTFLVRSGRRSFSTSGLEGLTDVFLPDNQDRARALRAYDKPVLEMDVRDANRIADALLAVVAVNRASQLEEEHSIDGLPWSPQGAETVPLDLSNYKWLPVVLLSVAANGGANPAGATTAAWKSAAETLKRTRVLECGEIGTKMVHKNQVVAESEPRSQWLPEDVLAVRRDLESYEDLAVAAQSMVNRQDILKDLRLVLGSLPLDDEVTPEHIECALDRAEIDAPAVADIRHRWAGNVSTVVDRVRPVLKLLEIPECGFEAAAEELDRLTAWLLKNLRAWHAPDLLSAARRSEGDYAMGVAAWRELGEVAQLPAWNAVLAELGDRYEAVENRDVLEQTRSHLEEAAPLLRGFARHVALAADDPVLFRRVEDVTRKFDGLPDWSKEWWEVPFVAVLNALTPLYEAICEVKPYVKLIKGSETVERLRDALAEAGIEVTADPYEVAAGNRRRLEQVLREVHDLRRAWSELNGSSQGAPDPSEPPGELDGAEYLDEWGEMELLAVALEQIDDEAFADACAGCSTLDEVRRQLDLTPEAIEERREERVDRERAAIRQKRVHIVAGQPFEIGASYSALFSRLDELVAPDGRQARKDAFVTLANVRKGSQKRSTPKGTPRPRPSADVTELVGVVGEMWAYRYLRSNFGEKAVTRESWVSEIGRSVLRPVEGEPNDISDGHGFDFRFRHGRKRWHVEVKATAGEDSQFEIGISEIEAATRLARRRMKWRILRVRNALAEQPEFDWLPNPFEDGFKEYFRLDKSGMRVSYSRR